MSDLKEKKVKFKFCPNEFYKNETSCCANLEGAVNQCYFKSKGNVLFPWPIDWASSFTNIPTTLNKYSILKESYPYINLILVPIYTLLSSTPCDAKQYFEQRSFVCRFCMNAFPNASYVALDPLACVHLVSMVKHLSSKLFWSWSMCSSSFSSSRMRPNEYHCLPTSRAIINRSSCDTRPALNGSWSAKIITKNAKFSCC